MRMVVVKFAGAVRGQGRGRAVSTPFGARVFTDEKTRGYQAQLRYAAQQEMGDLAPTDLPCALIVEARFLVPASWSEKKRLAALGGLIRPATTPDCDNIIKAIQDSFNKLVFADDRQIVELTLRKVYSEHPGLTIIVETIQPAARQPLRQADFLRDDGLPLSGAT